MRNWNWDQGLDAIVLTGFAGLAIIMGALQEWSTASFAVLLAISAWRHFDDQSEIKKLQARLDEWEEPSDIHLSGPK